MEDGVIMKPTDAHLAQLRDLTDYCSGVVEALSALHSTVQQYAWSIEAEQRELVFLDRSIATLELATSALKKAV
jgi:hypothetical protein